ncbi:TPA: LCP family protein [Streptococcus suis]
MKDTIKWLTSMTLAASLLVTGPSAEVFAQTTTQEDTSVVETTAVTHEAQTASPSSAQATENKPMSFLLLGTDTGSLGRTEHGRSDVLMVATFNPTSKRVTITSIPRDTYVEIVGKGFEDKINHAYAFGGPDMAVDTVNQFLQIDLDHYIVVNMGGLEQMVDSVGGIELTPPNSFSIDGYDFVAGQTVTADGKMALAYARERYTSGGDYARQERQREIIQAVVSKAASFDSLFNLQGILSALGNNLMTDLSMVDILNLVGQYKAADLTFETYQLTGEGTMIDGIYYDIADEAILEQVKAQLQIELGL